MKERKTESGKQHRLVYPKVLHYGAKIELAEAVCKDRDCHVHGNLKARGRTFEGKVIKKFNKRIAIEFERMIYVKKYERYKKSRTKIHGPTILIVNSSIIFC